MEETTGIYSQEDYFEIAVLNITKWLSKAYILLKKSHFLLFSFNYA